MSRLARIPRGCLLAVALGVAVSGCSSALRLSGFDEQPILSTAASSPRLLAGEQISVTVYGEASLSGNYMIDPSGLVSIPVAGKIKAAGLTTAELAEILVKKFRSEYLKDPKVTVSLAEVRGFLANRCRSRAAPIPPALTQLWPGAGNVAQSVGTAVSGRTSRSRKGPRADGTGARWLKNRASFSYKGALRCRCQLSREVALLRRLSCGWPRTQARSSAGRCAGQQRRQSLSRHPRLGTAHTGEKAVGRLQRRRHRSGRQVRVGDRPLLAGHRPRLSRHQGEPGPPFRRVRKGDQELWRRNVRVAARHSCRSRRQRVGDRRARGEPRRTQEVSGRGPEGKRRRQVQSRRQGADDAWASRA